MPAQGIPASQIVSDNPGVIAAGGIGIDMVAVVLTTSTRVPIGQPMQFSSALSVGLFFGLNAPEYSAALIYFNGFDNSPIKPNHILFAQYPQLAAVPPYLRGGSLAAMTLAQLQALTSGTILVTINGVVHTSGTINLASATSFSNAATIIQSALGATDATFTGAIAAATAAFTGSIAGNVLTVTNVSSGSLVVGEIIAGSGVTAGTQITGQITGASGAIGAYNVSVSQTVVSEALTGTYGILSVSAVSQGAIYPGQVVTGAGVTVGTTVTSNGSGTGNTGTYNVSPTQTVASIAMNSGAGLVTFDSVSNAFVITGGTPGTPGTIGFASNGTATLATSLNLVQANGAVDSQGAPIASPISFMTTLFAGFQNFGTLMTMFEPVIADKVAFADWTNSLNIEVMYSMWDISPLNAQPTPNLATDQIIAAGYNGTFSIYAPINSYLDAAMICGMVASIDFTRTNGRTTLAFRSQAGVTPEILNGQTAAQLVANGRNFYGTYSTPSEGFTWVYPGSVTGPFLWADSFVDAIWMKNQFQNALLQLLANVPSIPYNASGTGLIQAALNDPIQQAVNFGAIRSGITLSNAEVAEVNNAAGFNIATTLQNQGWYLLVGATPPTTRQARGSPPITFWYTDGQSVQSINLQSLEVQ